MIRNVATALPQMSRGMRRPQVPFYLKQRPFQFQPCCIMPVIPGETLKKGLFQIRAVTDPIRNPLIGWWYETYWFYVKIRDLAGREDFTAMFTDPTKDLAAYDTATNVQYFHKNGTESPAIGWTKLCLDECVEWYARYEGETAATAVIDGLPVAKINNLDALDSAILTSDLHANDVTMFTETGTNTLEASEVEAAMRSFELLKQANLMPMSYDDFIKSYGVRIPQEETHKPELIRYTRDWQYPSNTVVPTTGAVASAVSWSIRESMDKDRFFREPGFIFGMTCVRPKVYLKNYVGSLTAWMNSVYEWLPAVMNNDPRSSLKSFVATDGPVDVSAAEYYIDIKDLLLYGEQFVNFDPGTTSHFLNAVGLPQAAMADQEDKVYPVDVTELRSFFVDFATTTGYLAEANTIRSDGVINLNIATHQSQDTSPVSIGAVNV